jgi:hypothetical protein
LPSLPSEIQKTISPERVINYKILQNEKNSDCFINPFIYICVQQRLDQKESTPISTMGNCPGGALSR